MSFDWNDMESKAGGNFKPWATEGEHEVKLAKVTVVDKPGWKSPALQFEWEEDDYQYPRSVLHWLSLENANYRRIHARNILMVLGIKKEDAQTAIESAEKDTAREALIKAYQQVFDRAANRHPVVKIITRPQKDKAANGMQYHESDFADSSVRINTTRKQENTETVLGGEAAPDLNAEIPF